MEFNVQNEEDFITAIKARDFRASYLMGFYHRSIFPGINLILGQFGLSESHTEVLKGISPLKASIIRLFTRKEAKRLINKLDSVYEYVTKLKMGKFKDQRHAHAMLNTVEDLCHEVEESIYAFKEAYLDNRAAFLFESGKLLSMWHDKKEPPYILSPDGMNSLIKHLKASMLTHISATAKSVYESIKKKKKDDFYAAWKLHIDVLRQLDHEAIQEAITSESGNQSLSELTNLPDLQQFHIDVPELLSDPERLESIAFIDMDNLKKLNRKIGHDAADEVIKEVAILLEKGLEHRAKVYHRSGDEFLAVFHNTSSQEAKFALERVIEKVKSHSINTSQGRVQVTISAGIAAFPENGSDLKVLMKRANELMQQSKKAGKSRVKISTVKDK